VDRPAPAGTSRACDSLGGGRV